MCLPGVGECWLYWSEGRMLAEAGDGGGGGGPPTHGPPPSRGHGSPSSRPQPVSPQPWRQTHLTTQ